MSGVDRSTPAGLRSGIETGTSGGAKAGGTAAYRARGALLGLAAGDAVARGSWRGKEPPAIRGTGYCVAALEAAIWAVAGASDFKAAILRATNLGDDADTTAAIAGQLAGARFGAAGIPELWLELLAMRARIESLADGLHMAATGGGRWGFDEAFHAWWVEPGRILAGEHPGSPEREHHEFKLTALADAG